MTQEKIELIKYLKSNISKIPVLTEREKNVLRLRFGLDNGVMKTLAETAESITPIQGKGNAQNKFGVTRERVRQMEAKAIDKLKRWQKA